MDGPSSRSNPRPHLRIHAVNVYVRDQEQSLRFYVEQLGFDVAFDVRMQSGERWVAVSPPDGSAVLALIAPKPEQSECRLIGRQTGVVFVTEDVVAKYGEWRRRDVRFQYAPRLRRVSYDEANRLWGGVFTHFRDPDGNVFALVGFDAVTEQIEQQRRAAAEREQAERRAAQELEIAKQVQSRLFPQISPEIATLEYAGSCTQARQVGGDYFDFFQFSGTCFGFALGDIAGKGIAAALLMANLQANVRIHCSSNTDHLRPMLESVNRVFKDNTAEGAFATLFFGQYDDRTRRLQYANCGHMPPLLLRRDGQLDRLDPTATVLGLFTEWNCGVGERILDAGDTLAIYSDGISEAFNRAGEEFGEQRLIDALRRHRDKPCPEILANIIAEVEHYSGNEQLDDMTLIVARCR